MSKQRITDTVEEHSIRLDDHASRLMNHNKDLQHLTKNGTDLAELVHALSKGHTALACTVDFHDEACIRVAKRIDDLEVRVVQHINETHTKFTALEEKSEWQRGYCEGMQASIRKLERSMYGNGGETKPNWKQEVSERAVQMGLKTARESQIEEAWDNVARLRNKVSEVNREYDEAYVAYRALVDSQ